MSTNESSPAPALPPETQQSSEEGGLGGANVARVIAGLGSRMLAGIFDLGLLLGVYFSAAGLAMLFVPRVRSAAGDLLRNAMGRDWIFRGVSVSMVVLACAALLAVTWLFYVVAEIASGGRSPGKRALGLCVVRLDGRPISVWQSMLRNLVRLVDLAPGLYGVGLVAALASAKTQRLGDLCARTLVVRERRGVRSVQASNTASSPLAARLSPEELELLTNFWTRGPLMAPSARARLARQIAPLVRARLADYSGMEDESLLWALLQGVHEAPREEPIAPVTR